MNRPTVIKSLLLAALLAAGAAHAQLPADDPDWKEDDAAPPPTFTPLNLVPIDMPDYVTLKFGIDPATLTVGKDGVVRYVMVATNSSGALNAMYEAIRCSSGEVKVYARYMSNGWRILPTPDWRPLSDAAITRHSRALAYQGVCSGRAALGSPQAMIKKLKENASR